MIKSKKKWLILAPHLSYPTLNGADVVVDGYFVELCNVIDEIHIFTEKTYIIVKDGKKEEFSYHNKNRSKYLASLRVLLKNSSYQIEKFITPGFKSIVKKISEKENFDVVFYSFIATSTVSFSFRNHSEMAHLVYTHNDDIKYYNETFLTSTNSLIKKVARLSNKWVTNYILQNIDRLTFVNITKEDDDSYKQRFPGIKSFILPAGANIADAQLTPQTTPVDYIISFVGSLSAQMNVDAIRYFSDYFWPEIKEKAKRNVVVQIIGSNPEKPVKDLCSENDWRLCPNVSDAELINLLQNSAFSIMPFKYSNGSKLKLLKSLSLGVPVLSTECAAYLELPKCCLVSDNADDWVSHINTTIDSIFDQDTREEVSNFSKSFSWEAIIANLRKEHPSLF